MLSGIQLPIIIYVTTTTSRKVVETQVGIEIVKDDDSDDRTNQDWCFSVES